MKRGFRWEERDAFMCREGTGTDGIDVVDFISINTVGSKERKGGSGGRGRGGGRRKRLREGSREAKGQSYRYIRYDE
jgi:hypothetical protein